MKKNNLWHFIWIVGIYIVLTAILILVVEYKVKWQNKDLNTYLYFYNCSGKLCTTNEKVTNYYSRIKCDDRICPYIKEIKNNLVILADSEKEYLFDYLKEEIINKEYNKYSFINDDILVRNNDNKYGIISLNGEVLVSNQYNKIVDYKNGYLAYAEEGKVGIVNAENSIDIKPNYEDVILIDGEKYAYLEDNKYYIASYDTELPINNNTYDYLYATDSIILIAKDNKIDILNSNLESNLLLKIDTSYTYTVEKERESLNIYKEGNLLHFTVSNNENTTNYIYDLKNNKLFN